MATANIYDLTDTWNNSGTAFKGIRMNVTNTNSAAGARVLELAVGGTKIFDVDVAGNWTAATGTLTSTSASALAVGRQGATDPVLKVNANTASVATGVEITGAAAAAGVNVAAISSGTNENLTINAKGSGTITLNPTGTGNVISARNFRISDSRTFGILDTGTASATSGAATLNKSTGKITSESLTTAAGAAYTLTLTNSQIAAADIVLVSLANGTNTQGVVVQGLVTPAAGSVVITVRNEHASQAFNGTIVVSYMVIKVT
jgi:hypothetical protein